MLPLDPAEHSAPSVGLRKRAAATTDPADDAALMRAVAAGSATAFDRLVARHAPTLLRLARRQLGDTHEAEDVVQDCLARLWSHAPHWQPRGGGLGAWLHRVTVNLCYDRRRRYRLVPVPELPDRADPAPLADAAIEAADLGAAFAAALAALPERHRTALTLCYLEGISNAAAAERLDLHVKAMESLLFRARQRFRTILDDRQVPWRDMIAGAGGAESPLAPPHARQTACGPDGAAAW